MRTNILLTPILLLASFASFSQVLKEKTTAPTPKLTPATTLAPKPKPEQVAPPVKIDLSKATFLDAFVTVYTGLDNKDHDTHWSFGLFDQNDHPIASFHDDSNTDEYPADFTTPALKMHLDNATTFGAFANGGRIHINIAPNGNDTWKINQFRLTLDFLNPNVTKEVTWGNFALSQDVKDMDLYFRYDGTNFITR
jgi:hypothetical protein